MNSCCCWVTYFFMSSKEQGYGTSSRWQPCTVPVCVWRYFSTSSSSFLFISGAMMFYLDEQQSHVECSTLLSNEKRNRWCWCSVRDRSLWKWLSSILCSCRLWEREATNQLSWTTLTTNISLVDVLHQSSTGCYTDSNHGLLWLTSIDMRLTSLLRHNSNQFQD